MTSITSADDRWYKEKLSEYRSNKMASSNLLEIQKYRFSPPFKDLSCEQIQSLCVNPRSGFDTIFPNQTKCGSGQARVFLVSSGTHRFAVKVGEVDADGRIGQEIARHHFPFCIDTYASLKTHASNGRGLLFMEYIEGETLEKVVVSTKSNPTALAPIYQQFVFAMSHLIQHHIKPGDIHGRNIFILGDGTLKLLDYGEYQLLKKLTDQELLAVAKLICKATADVFIQGLEPDKKKSAREKIWAAFESAFRVEEENRPQGAQGKPDMRKQFISFQQDIVALFSEVVSS